MNKKIKEFEKQCWSHYINGVLIDGHLHFDVEKFAELIVRECCDAADDWYKNHNNIQWDPAQHIKNHFGVKE